MTTMNKEIRASSAPRQKKSRPLVALPEIDVHLDQDDEWFLVKVDGEWRQVGMHDYDAIYEIRGLYERVVYDILKCDSPATIRRLLDQELRAAGTPAEDLRVLDLGAGNGMVGEELAGIGVQHIVGVDIIQAAADALDRDRPDLYSDYYVTDMCKLSDRQRRIFESHKLNCLTCVAALGFGDIPADAFLASFELIATGGWAAFNIKECFLDPQHESGFGRLVRRMKETAALDVACQVRYCHRVGVDRKPIHYMAIIGRKKSEFSE